MELHKDGGAVAQSPILRTTKPIKGLEKSGDVRFVNDYQLASIRIEPPSMRPAWLILSLTKDLWCEPRTGGHFTLSRLLDYGLVFEASPCCTKWENKRSKSLEDS